jgi:hypothetical protein
VSETHRETGSRLFYAAAEARASQESPACAAAGPELHTAGDDSSSRLPLNRDRLPDEHRRNDLWVQIMTSTEPGCRCEIDGRGFGSIEVHTCSGVKDFALAGIVNENLKMVRVLFDNKRESFPLSFVSPAVAHIRQYQSDRLSLANGLLLLPSFAIAATRFGLHRGRAPTVAVAQRQAPCERAYWGASVYDQIR